MVLTLFPPPSPSSPPPHIVSHFSSRLQIPEAASAPSAPKSTKLVDHGVHAFIVPLRDANGSTLPGIEIRDCGYKVRCRN